MSDDRNATQNSFLMWSVIIVIPVASFGLYVYEVFFKEETRIVRNVSKGRESATSLYKEARTFEVDGDNLKAYANYISIVEILENTEDTTQIQIVDQARERIKEIAKALDRKITFLANDNKWTELSDEENAVAVILPDRLEWLRDSLKSKEKKKGKKQNNNDNDDKEKLIKEIAIFQSKLDNLVSVGNFEQAFATATRLIKKNKDAQFKKRAKEIVAHIHYNYALKKYQEIKNTMGGMEISALKQDFSREITNIKEHLKTYIKTANQNDIDVHRARKILNELK